MFIIRNCHAERREASIRQRITNRFFVPQNDIFSYMGHAGACRSIARWAIAHVLRQATHDKFKDLGHAELIEALRAGAIAHVLRQATHDKFKDMGHAELVEALRAGAIAHVLRQAQDDPQHMSFHLHSPRILILRMTKGIYKKGHGELVEALWAGPLRTSFDKHAPPLSV